MNALRDPKAMAKSLRVTLAERQVVMSHSECLEVVARQLGYADWNTASAVITKSKAALTLPSGWIVTGTEVKHYDVGLDPAKSGQVTIRSRVAKPDGFVTLMQTIDAARYRDQRLRLRNDLSCALQDGWAAIWMRVDGFDGKPIRFDNLSERDAEGTLTGVQEWSQRSIVLQVPDAAESVSYGFMMQGEGQCWCKAFRLDAVDASVPLTSHARGMTQAPTNLDFTMPA